MSDAGIEQSGKSGGDAMAGAGAGAGAGAMGGDVTDQTSIGSIDVSS